MPKYTPPPTSEKHHNKPPNLPYSQYFDLSLADMDIPVWQPLNQSIMEQFAQYLEVGMLQGKGKGKGVDARSWGKLGREVRLAVVGWYREVYGCEGMELAEDKQHSDKGGNAVYIHFCPSIVTYITYCIHALTQPSDSILITTPVYASYASVIQLSGRRVVPYQMIYRQSDYVFQIEKNSSNCNSSSNSNQSSGDGNKMRGKFRLGNFYIDFKEFQDVVRDHKVRMVLLSHPHNPSGKVFTRQQITNIVTICKKHNTYILSDQILSDLHPISPTTPPTPTFHSLAREFPTYRNIIVANSISKSFNYSSIQGGYGLVGDRGVGEAIGGKMGEFGEEVDLLGVVGIGRCLSSVGKQWLVYIRKIITNNYLKLLKFQHQKAPHLKISLLQASYLIHLNLTHYFPTSLTLTPLLQTNHIWVLDLASNYYPPRPGIPQVRICIACEEEQFQRFLGRLEAVLRASWVYVGAKL